MLSYNIRITKDVNEKFSRFSTTLYINITENINGNGHEKQNTPKLNDRPHWTKVGFPKGNHKRHSV